jgi:hypothetical protein
MTMSFYNTFIAVVLVLSTSTVFGASNPKSYAGHLIHTHSPYVRVGGDKVVFGYKVTPSCDNDSLRAAAIELKTRTTTDRWDDLWYAFSVPQGRCLVMGYYNLSSAKFGWAAILNKPTSWAVRSNSQGWQDLGNGNQKKYSFKINGQNVDLDIFNPNNSGGFSGNDILISFGY